MSNEKKIVKEITSMDIDFAKWYTDIVRKAELAEYSSIRGCMIIRPYGFKIWENIQSYLDKQFKKTGHENVYLPMFISESLLQKESDHVEGFAPEAAWITHGGSEKLNERMCVRPTSETLFCEHYSNIIESYKDLPKLYNQWCSVVRWEKSTRPFLRTTEFLWQEGHTAHATEEEAIEEVLKILDIYEDFCKNILAIPVIKGKKTDMEKFAGAKQTYTIESMMHDGKALQSGTTHNFSDIFSKAFDIKFTDKNGNHQYVYQTSWGISTRLIGAIIMVHGDNKGLCMPPRIAPIQLIVVPINTKDENVMKKSREIYNSLKDNFICSIDESNKSAGWKFNQYDMKGIPIRLEIGARDLDKNSITLYRRDNSEKILISLESNLNEVVKEYLNKIHEGLYNKALKSRDQKTYEAKTMDELKEIYKSQTGFTKVMLCDDQECETNIKNEVGITSRCIPFNQTKIHNKCIYCNKPTDKMVLFGKSY
ncbi:proline--tRNA ligase [Candidatus Arthromitus sp. SFB-rat-Yit]|uniref:proline--tRNA ligase n=1 Tax=Candidatus Arthromitus sp. SFB-rat-Yit TaxID=1041504 RepID=UPI000227A631|nr:proline--tRNA ligase [Candidatus Arthromitus sp. SFB-rat-Yit]BAK80591.1 prolyl-tRNA synthetase [Candidatus Arthromitus sp. SFB-rat-Yit]